MPLVLLLKDGELHLVTLAWQGGFQPTRALGPSAWGYNRAPSHGLNGEDVAGAGRRMLRKTEELNGQRLGVALGQADDPQTQRTTAEQILPFTIWYCNGAWGRWGSVTLAGGPSRRRKTPRQTPCSGLSDPNGGASG